MLVKNKNDGEVGDMYSSNDNEVWVHFNGIYHGYNKCYSKKEFEENFIVINL